MHKQIRLLFLLLVCAMSASAATVQLEIPRDARQEYAIQIGKAAVEQSGHVLSVKHKRKIPLPAETYEVILKKRKIHIRAADGRGAVYAMLDLSDLLESGMEPEALGEGIHRPRMRYRAIQYNLPFAADFSGQEEGAFRDLEFWTAFLDMMVDNRFNALALQSAFPGHTMVQDQEMEGRLVLEESELSDWQAFWTQLFVLAGERGIETYLLVEGAPVGTAMNPVVREVLKQNPGLTGVGLLPGSERSSAQAGDSLREAVLAASHDAGRPVQFLQVAKDEETGTETRESSVPRVLRVHAGFHRLRWGHPDYARSLVRRTGKSQMDGLMIGSEAILPPEDLMTSPGSGKTWRWQFERQWLLYSVWGRLLYDPGTPDSIFERMLEERFPESDGEKLLTAWKLASSVPLELSRFFKGTEDASFFMEPSGWSTAGGQRMEFLDINQVIYHEVADPDYINMRLFIRGTMADWQGKTTPFHVVKKLQDTVRGLDRLMEELETGLPGESNLAVELADIEAWRHLGKYFAEKIKAGVAVESGRYKHSPIHLAKAFAGLKRAIGIWKDYVEAAYRFNRKPSSRNAEAPMSLAGWTPLVEKDVVLSQEFYPTDSTWEAVSLKGEPHARHEAAFIECGGDLYLLGGRRIQPVDRLDLDTGEWQAMAEPPIELHHFQPVQYDGKIWVIGAMTGAYPDETPVPHAYIFDPESNTWTPGPEIPADRLRGGAGAVFYGGRIYLIGGIKNGHRNGFVPWLDRLDPSTGTWDVLPDAPNARDHFQAVAMGSKLYAAGGRRTSLDTGEVFSLTVPEVDAFDIVKGTWSTVSSLPTPRAGTSALTVNGYLVVAGGEAASQSAAYSEVEAFNPESGVWIDWPSLLQGRHGTGMVLVDGQLYTTSGCAKRGGSPELTTTEALKVVE